MEARVKTVIINLRRRTDRWAAIQTELRKLGIADYTRYEALDCAEPLRGNAGSQHACLSMGGPILILEDDCVFTQPHSKLAAAIDELPPEWDLLYLGATLREHTPKYSENLCRVTACHASHAILYSQKGAAWCAANFDPAGTYYAYDDWLYSAIREKLMAFVVRPMMAVQSNGWSDAFKMQTNYDIAATSKFMT